MTVWPTLRPYIPRNLTLFSLDDYHPAWMYPSSHCSGTTGPLCKRCRDGGPAVDFHNSPDSGVGRWAGNIRTRSAASPAQRRGRT